MATAFNTLAKFKATGFNAIALGAPSSDDMVLLLSGAATSAAGIVAELPAEPPVGSVYIDGMGFMWRHATAGTAAGNWVAMSAQDTAAITSLVSTSIDAGASGTAGSIDIFPATASKGKIALTATNNTGNTTTTITNAEMGQASTITIPDPGAAAASFVLTEGAQTVNGVKTFGSAPVLPGASFTSAPTTTDGVGAKNGATVTAVEKGAGDVVHKTVLTLTATPITITRVANDSSGYGGVKLYDFPAGMIRVLGAATDLAVTFGANFAADGSGDFSLGSTAPDDSTLTNADVDIMASTGMTDPFVASVGAADGAVANAGLGGIDGTGTAAACYLNVICDAGDVTVGNSSATVTGTVTLTWINCGDF